MAKKTARKQPKSAAGKRAPRRSSAKPAAAKGPRPRKPGPRELHLMIQKKAYELYARRGYVHGRSWDDWIEAERYVLAKTR